MRRTAHAAVWVLPLALVVVGGSQGCSARTSPGESALPRAVSCVAAVESTLPGLAGKGVGAAFLVGPHVLLTAAHLVPTDSRVTLRFSEGSTGQATVRTRLRALDTAVLALDAAVTPPCDRLTLRRDAKLGEPVWAVGSPYGLSHSVTAGIVSNARRTASEVPDLVALGLDGGTALIQTDAATSSGTSGGALLDRDGEVLGLIIAGVPTAQGLGFAISARALLDAHLVP